MRGREVVQGRRWEVEGGGEEKKGEGPEGGDGVGFDFDVSFANNDNEEEPRDKHQEEGVVEPPKQPTRTR